MKIVWTREQIFKKTPLALVAAVALLLGFNVYLHVTINQARQELARMEAAAAKPARAVTAAFSKKIDLGEKSCPHARAGNPQAPLTFTLFESATCPYCVAQNKVLDELLPEYGDLWYGEWFDVVNCPQESEKYRISGVPTFVFTAQGAEKPPAYGFLDREQMIDYICRVSGGC